VFAKGTPTGGAPRAIYHLSPRTSPFLAPLIVALQRRAARGAFPFRALAGPAGETRRRAAAGTSRLLRDKRAYLAHLHSRTRATGSRLRIPRSHALMRNISVPISDISKSAPTRDALCPVLDFNARLGSVIAEPSRPACKSFLPARSRLLPPVSFIPSFFFSPPPFGRLPPSFLAT